MKKIYKIGILSLIIICGVIFLVKYANYKSKNIYSIVEYNYYGYAYNSVNNFNLKEVSGTLLDKSKLNNMLKDIVKKKENEICEFDYRGIPKCIENNLEDSEEKKYYIIYFGDGSYKVIYEEEFLNQLGSYF